MTTLSPTAMMQKTATMNSTLDQSLPLLPRSVRISANG